MDMGRLVTIYQSTSTLVGYAPWVYSPPPLPWGYFSITQTLIFIPKQHKLALTNRFKNGQPWTALNVAKISSSPVLCIR
jgi:hypothetical protein